MVGRCKIMTDEEKKAIEGIKKDGRECFTMEYYYAKMLQSLLEKE